MSEPGGTMPVGVGCQSCAHLAERERELVAEVAELRRQLAESERAAGAMRQRIQTFLLERSEWCATHPNLNAVTHADGLRGYLSTLLANLHNEMNNGLPDAGRGWRSPEEWAALESNRDNLATVVEEDSRLIEEVAADRAALLAAAKAALDPDPCQLDHHGNCQAHSIGNPCEQKLLREAIAGR
jgi:hypothetical protein